MKVATRPQQVTPNQVFEAVSEVTGIDISDLKTPNGKREQRDARRIGMYLVYDKCGYSLNKTANEFNCTNHTTIIRSHESYFNLCDTDKGFREKVIKVKQMLNIL